MSEWLAIVEALDTSSQEILENQDRIMGMLKDVRERLSTLESKLDENLLVGARTGLHHLLDGLNSDVEPVRSDEFILAHQEFSKLISLNPEATTLGISGEVENKYLISVGWWGNYHYFNLRGDRRNALISAYECVRQYPDIGLLLFPPGIFSKDYARSKRLILDELINVKRSLEHLHGMQSSYYKDWAKKVGVGAAAATGLVTAVLFGMNPVSVSAAYGGAKAYEGIQPLKPDPLDVQSLEDKVESLVGSMNKILSHVADESNRRIEELRKHTLDDLM